MTKCYSHSKDLKKPYFSLSFMLTSDETNQISKDQKNLGGKYVYKIRVNFTQPSVSLKQRNIGSAIDRQQN